MGAAATFACLGLEWLGQCNYNPALPANLYFSLGEVVWALAFTRDLQRSLPTLIKAAAFDEYARETTAFHDFAYRTQIRRAAYAAALLRIIADPHYCQTLVSRQPWRVANMRREISEKNLYCRGAEQFIREVAYQAIIRDDSMMTREVGYYGFGTAPLLSEALFSDWFIITQYNPLDSFFTASGAQVTPMLLKRFNSAAERCYRALIETKEIFHSQASFSIQSYYRSVFMRAHSPQTDPNYDFQIPMEMNTAIHMAARMANRLLAGVTAVEYQSMYLGNIDDRRHDVLETLVEIIYEALNAVANNFKGFDDPYWMLAMDVMHDIFHSIGTEPDGVTPFQQRLTVKIIGKLKDNMKGYYPAILRVLLAAVCPYKHQAPQPNSTAFNILKDAMYIVLRRLPKLAEKEPTKIAKYFPPGISYDPKTNRITQ